MTLVFCPEDFHLKCYGKLIKYFHSVIAHFKIPSRMSSFTQYSQDIQTDNSLILVLSYCALPRLLCTNAETREIRKDSKIILLVAEPNVNIQKDLVDDVKWFKWIKSNALMIITLMKPQLRWLKSVFELSCHSFYVGYIEHEDLNSRDIGENVQKICDVVLPGFENDGQQRTELVALLRKSKLTVNARPLYEKDLDQAIRDSKIYAYYPQSVNHHTFPGQRILWALNKGIAVVSTLSSDNEAEEFYKGLYVTCQTAEELVRKCFELAATTEWEKLANKSYKRYKTEFHAFKIFPNSLLNELRAVAKETENTPEKKDKKENFQSDSGGQ